MWGCGDSKYSGSAASWSITPRATRKKVLEISSQFICWNLSQRINLIVSPFPSLRSRDYFRNPFAHTVRFLCLSRPSESRPKPSKTSATHERSLRLQRGLPCGTHTRLASEAGSPPPGSPHAVFAPSGSCFRASLPRSALWTQPCDTQMGKRLLRGKSEQ